MNWPAWKASKPLKGFRGSNPLLSANDREVGWGGQRPRGVRPAGVQAVAREPDGVEQFQRDQDVRRQFEFRDVVLLLVEVVQERVVGRA